MAWVRVADHNLGVSDLPTHFVEEPYGAVGGNAVTRPHQDEQALKSEVSRMIGACEKGVVADCRIIDVLAHHEDCLHDQH